MSLADYDEALALWQRTPGVVIRSADSRESIARFLDRNPGLSFVARLDGTLIGCALCGHDGRRGYLHHVCVDPAHRGHGLGTRLVQSCVEAARATAGIDKFHADVLTTNEGARRFWTRLSWQLRTDIVRYSFNASPDANA